MTLTSSAVFNQSDVFDWIVILLSIPFSVVDRSDFLISVNLLKSFNFIDFGLCSLVERLTVVVGLTLIPS